MFTGTLAPVTNADDWIESFKLTDADTGDAIDISAATEIKVIIRDRRTLAEEISATLTGGTITRPETGVFEWTFTASQMGGLDAATTYEVVIRITIDSISNALVIGTLPVLNG
jgi:hypothetical protein